MGDFFQLFQSLGDMLVALLAIFTSLGSMLTEHWGLSLWVVFWTFLVRWPDFRKALARGAWVPCLLLYVIVCITWAVNTGPSLNLEGLATSSIGEKLLLGGIWIAIALLCGRVQEVLGLTPASIEITGPPDGVPTAHGHDDDHGHGHAVAAGHH